VFVALKLSVRGFKRRDTGLKTELSPITSPIIGEEQIALLRNNPLFGELPRGELKYLAYTLNRLSLEPGTVICRENEPGDSFYIVISGSVDVIMGLETPDEKLLATHEAGEHIGEMSLVIPGGKRSASLRTRVKSQLWVMNRDDFDELLHRQPHVAYSMVKVMSNRLRNSDNAAFHDLRAKNRQLQLAYDELKAAQEQIIEKEKLEKELQLAAEIQISLLPRSLPSMAGVDFGGHMDPARSVGGDLFDVFQLDEYRVGVLIGDVADKGVPSAIFMARTHALLTAESLRGGAPGEVLHSVNSYLTRLEQGDLFVTVIYGIIDVRTGIFTYARAGHELPVLLTGPGVSADLPKKESLPIGIFPEIPLDEQSVLIPPGGTLLLFTDGMCDCRNPQGEEYGRQRINNGLANLHGQTAQIACDTLIQSLLDFRQGAPQDDDVTLVLLHRS
jgi:serine phosphatase RsbU (regulator of sigma subunit)